MRFHLSTAMATVGAFAVLVPAANAADLIEPMPAPPPVVQPVATGGWYLRGDVGYVFSDRSSGKYRLYERGQRNGERYETYTTQRYDSIELEDAISGGVGVGYRFNDYFRTDITADYFSTDLRGSTNCAGASFDECHFEDSSSADIWTIMANAYIDAGTYFGITPYIGGGLGVANVSYDTLHNDVVCADGAPGANAPGSICGESFRHQGFSEWRFAASLMAGASYAITRNLFFDAGYKYTHIDDGEAFGFDRSDIARGARGVQGYDDGFDIHSIRAGLRYEFGGGGFGKGKGKAPAPAPMPIYAEAPVYK